MQQELIAQMDGKMLASPATGAKMLLDAWETIVAKMHRICVADPESNPYAIALRRAERLHPSYGRPVPLCLLNIGSKLSYADSI